MSDKTIDRKLRILVVDDELHGRPFFREFENYNVTLTTSTEEALEKLQVPYDVLVCHIKYDNMILGEFAKRKHEDILTIDFSAGGLSNYMVKPLGYDEFAEADTTSTSYDNIRSVLKKRGLI